MPDRWGRITGNDFMGIANAFSGIQAMGQRNTRFKQDQQVFAQKQEEVARQKKIKSVANDMLSFWDKNGFADVPRGETSPLVYNAALGLASTSYADSAKGKEQLNQVRKNAHKREYGLFEQYQAGILDSVSKNDIPTATNLIEQMSEAVPIPYKYKFDQKSGNFVELYRESSTDQWQKTGQVPLADVIKRIQATGEKEYAMESFAAKEATRQWNANAWINKTAVAKKDGKLFYVTPQKDVNKPNSVSYVVVDENNQEIKFNSAKEMAKAGIRLEDLKREKTLSSIDSEKALTKQRNATANELGARERLSAAKLNALGRDAKFTEWTLYDDHGNKYTAKDKAQFDYYVKQGFTPVNNKPDMEQHDRNVKSFVMQTQNIGMVQDEESGNVSGVVKREDLGKVIDMAQKLNLTLYDESGYKIDGGWFKSDKPAVKLSVLPFGTKKLNNMEDLAKRDEQDKHENIIKRKKDTYAAMKKMNDLNDYRINARLNQDPRSLPKDMGKWNVQQIKQGSKIIPVVIVDGGPVALTEEQFGEYKKYIKNNGNAFIKVLSNFKTKRQKPDPFAGFKRKRVIP